jgi:hydrogenase expression/formation protein HypC
MCLAIPGKLVEKSEIGGILAGKVQFGGITREACLDFLPEAQVGDYVLVHVGFAISKIDEEEAHKTYQYLEEIGVIDEELGLKPDSASPAAIVCPIEAKQ